MVRSFFKLSGTVPSWAQTPVLQFKSTGVENGFSDSRISEIVQDGLGIVWTVSRLGINRYDGNQVTVYHLQNDLVISDLVKDSDGHIVAATDKGLYYFNREKNAFIAVTGSSAKNNAVLRHVFLKIISAHGGAIGLRGTKGHFIGSIPSKTQKSPKPFILIA